MLIVARGSVKQYSCRFTHFAAPAVPRPWWEPPNRAPYVPAAQTDGSIPRQQRRPLSPPGQSAPPADSFLPSGSQDYAAQTERRLPFLLEAGLRAGSTTAVASYAHATAPVAESIYACMCHCRSAIGFGMCPGRPRHGRPRGWVGGGVGGWVGGWCAGVPLGWARGEVEAGKGGPRACRLASAGKAIATASDCWHCRQRRPAFCQRTRPPPLPPPGPPVSAGTERRAPLSAKDHGQRC